MAGAPAALLAGVEARMNEPARADAGQRHDAGAPMDVGDALAGRRLMVLLFDVSSMQPEDVQRAVDSATKYVNEQMAAGRSRGDCHRRHPRSTCSTDFTGERERVDTALGQLAYTDGIATDAATGQHPRRTDEAAAAGGRGRGRDERAGHVQQRRPAARAAGRSAETLAPIEQKKAIVYFSAGMQRSGQDNQVELRAAVNAAVRANVAIYPVDTRGLQAVVPGGDARQAQRARRPRTHVLRARRAAAVLPARRDRRTR